MTEPGRLHLRLVANTDPRSEPAPDTDDLNELWVEPNSADPLLEEPAAPKPEPAPKRRSSRPRPERLQRNSGLFGVAPLPWLVSPDCPLAARWRLYFLLQLKSYQGTEPIRLTNDRAAELGLDRFCKRRHLRELEILGLVAVKRVGKKVPEVTLCSIPGWPPRQ